MPVSKTRKRKVAKKYEMVTFDTPIFEGEFTLPSPKHLNLKVLSGFENGNVAVLVDWLRDAGIAKEDIEAFESLDGEELQEFMKAWTDGEVSVPKSSK